MLALKLMDKNLNIGFRTVDHNTNPKIISKKKNYSHRVDPHGFLLVAHGVLCHPRIQ